MNLYYQAFNMERNWSQRKIDTIQASNVHDYMRIIYSPKTVIMINESLQYNVISVKPRTTRTLVF